MKVSIAMATYNGEAYLQEQLDSFVQQTRQPDELVVCDDVSSDSTLSILRDFAKISPFIVQVYVNESNLGYTHNFQKALQLCIGDIIFFSDQDDIWLSEKIKRVENVFLYYKKKHVVINNAQIVGSDLNKNNKTFFGENGIINDPFDVKLGCCMAVKKTFSDWALPIPTESFGHDGWFSKLAYLLGVRHEIEDCLQWWRRHETAFSDYRVEQKRFDRFWRFLNKRKEDNFRLQIKKLQLLKKKVDEEGRYIVYDSGQYEHTDFYIAYKIKKIKIKIIFCKVITFR